jgi:hypothetical protein
MNFGNNIVSWYGLDESGMICPSGLYTVVVQADGHFQKKTVVVMN